MMALSQDLQLSFEEKLTKFQEERKMPLLTNIERRALARGQQLGAKETRQQDMLKILEKRFGNLPENLINTIKKIDDMSVLESFFLETITVNSVAEFEQLIINHSENQN
jgi:hypothetical protein